MIPILYDTNETAFVSNGLGRLRDCISCVVTEERNGVYECDFEYPVDGYKFEEIKVGRIIGVTHDESEDIQPFDIVSFTRPIDGVVSFHCTHISYRQSYLTVTGSNINSLADAFTLLGDATPSNPFTYTTDKPSTGYMSAADGKPKTVRSLLGGVEGSILDAYGGEYEWDKFNVILHSARGQNRNFSIRYGVNMLDYEEELDSQGTYSSCVPYWTDGTNTVVGDRQDSGSNTITGRGECVPLDVSDKFDSKPTKARVNAMGLSVMNAKNPMLPSQNIHVEFVRLQDMGYEGLERLYDCKLCDTIKVVFPNYNTTGNFKIVKTVWDVLQDRYESMELGDLSVTLAEALGISDGSSKTSSTGIVYYETASMTISSTDIDSPTTGASISLPPGTYVITGQWAFYTRSTTGTTNSECQIYNSTGSSYIARQRVFAAGNNWNVLSCTGVVTLTTTSTVCVRGATSRAYTTATDNWIRAVQIS